MSDPNIERLRKQLKQARREISNRSQAIDIHESAIKIGRAFSKADRASIQEIYLRLREAGTIKETTRGKEETISHSPRDVSILLAIAGEIGFGFDVDAVTNFIHLKTAQEKNELREKKDTRRAERLARKDSKSSSPAKGESQAKKEREVKA